MICFPILNIFNSVWGPKAILNHKFKDYDVSLFSDDANRPAVKNIRKLNLKLQLSFFL